MESMKEKLTEYAQLLVRVGLNIQRGQPLVISSPVECAFFARLCAAEAYQAGCREVVMNWGDDELGRMKYLHAADEVFDTVPLWRRHFYNDYALEGAAYLAISASDPENLKGVDHSRIVRAQQASGRALKDFDRLQMCGGFPWCIASIPIPSWAKKVFPDLAESEAMDKLWEAIFQAVRITGDGRCVDKWHRHIETLAHRVEKLNQLNFKSLHYTNSLGTDLTVELPEDHIWEAGNDVTLSGRTYIANIPTEEVFTSPLKTGVNGVVYSALPLSHNGTIIDKFHFVVKDGKIVEVHAEQGEEALKAAVTVDEGASYFGEVALVPYLQPEDPVLQHPVRRECGLPHRLRRGLSLPQGRPGHEQGRAEGPGPQRLHHPRGLHGGHAGPEHPGYYPRRKGNPSVRGRQLRPGDLKSERKRRDHDIRAEKD